MKHLYVVTIGRKKPSEWEVTTVKDPLGSNWIEVVSCNFAQVQIAKLLD